MGPKKPGIRKSNPKPQKRTPPKKESGNKMSTLAAKVLQGKQPTKQEAKSLAASVLSQDETKGKRKK